MADSVLCWCGLPVGEGRVQLGFKTCIRHGEAEAQEEIQAKQRRVVITYNKGGYQYIGKGESARQALLDAGRKESALQPNHQVPPSTTRRKTSPDPTKPKRNIIGVYWLGNDRYWWYEGDDLARKGATRSARFSKSR